MCVLKRCRKPRIYNVNPTSLLPREAVSGHTEGGRRGVFLLELLVEPQFQRFEDRERKLRGAAGTQTKLSVDDSHLQQDWAAMAMRYASQLLSTGQITGNVQTLLAELRSRLQVVSDRTAELVALSENLDVSTDAAASAEVNRFTAMPVRYQPAHNRKASMLI